MDWCQLGKKQYLKPMMIPFTDACKRHLTHLSWPERQFIYLLSRGTATLNPF